MNLKVVADLKTVIAAFLKECRLGEEFLCPGLETDRCIICYYSS